MSHPHKQGVCQQLQWCLVSKVEHKYTAGQVFPHHTHTHKHCTCAGYIPIPINGTVLYKTRSITVTCSILNLLLLPITKDRRGEIPGDHCCLYLLVLAKLKYKYNKIKMGGSARGDAIIAHVAGAVPTSAATADAVCTATTITPALTSCTLHWSAPTLTFIHLSLSHPSPSPLPSFIRPHSHLYWSHCLCVCVHSCSVVAHW